MIGATTYAEAIREGHAFLLDRYPEVFVMGQGLWSPWYVGMSMRDLDADYGTERIMDMPVSEAATTAAAVGVALGGFRPIIVHPRMDFMILASDAIVNEAAKWGHMFGGRSSAPITVRGIINRGGEQGAQHSQALHAWYAHIPGLRVVMPATPADARDLLIASVLSDDPVLYIDDRWLYEREATLPPAAIRDLRDEGPRLLRDGADLTLAAAGYSTWLCEQAADRLAEEGIEAAVIDLRVLNPLQLGLVARSVEATGRLCVVDGGWRTCGLAGEVIAGVSETISPQAWRARPCRLTLPDAPAPSSAVLEARYYADVDDVLAQARACMKDG